MLYWNRGRPRTSVAGGGHYYFTLRGLGDAGGFVAGTALLLDYTIDIALFAVASAGYLNFFLPYFFGVRTGAFVMTLGPLKIEWLWLAESSALIAFLVWLNIRGIRESSLLNEVLGLIDICTESGRYVILGLSVRVQAGAAGPSVVARISHPAPFHVWVVAGDHFVRGT